MAVRFVLGRAGTGKTRHCLDAILAELDQPSGEFPLLLIVPEQASFQMERALAARSTRRGYSRAEVLSFSRLAARVFSQFADGPAELTPQSRVLALRFIAASHPGPLKAFGAAAHTNGFYERMARLIEELLRENVAADALRDAASALDDADAQDRVQAVAQLYKHYLEFLGRDRCDPAQRLARLRDQLAEATWLHDAAVWIDGFAGFTGQETETLIALARIARSVEITLLLDPADLLRPGPALAPDELRLFHRTEQTYASLRAALSAMERPIPPPAQTAAPRQLTFDTALDGPRVELLRPILLDPPLPYRFAQSPAIAAIERAFARGPAEPQPSASPTAGVRVLSCESHRAELRQAARFIRRSMIESGGALRYRDFAIIARELEPFHRLVGETLREFDIPYFLDRRRSLAGHALVQFVSALLAVTRRDAPLPLMIRLLQSGLLPLERDVCEQLENAALAREPAGLADWRESVWPPARRRWRTATEAEPRELQAGRSVIASALAPLALLARQKTQHSAAEWCRALLSTLEALHIRRRLGEWMRAARAAEQWDVAETHRLAWECLCGVLDDMDSVLGQVALNADDFATMLESSLADATLGLAPPTVDQVLVSSIERSRHPEVKHAWLFAFNEGIFPKRSPDDAILSESERSALVAAGLRAPAPARDDVFAERLLAYIAATRPSRSLTISFARRSAAGDEIFPSPFLSDVRRALPGLALETATSDAPPLTLSELAEFALRSDRPEPRVAELERRLRRDAATSAALDHLLRGRAYHNTAAPIPPRNSPDSNGFVWYGSPSELETALQCPFRWFAGHALRIEERRGPVPVEWELGSIAHEIIAAVCSRALGSAPQIQQVTDEDWSQWLGEEFAQQARLVPAPSELAALLSALEPFIRELLLAHAARWRRGQFNLLATENRFGEIRARDRHAALRFDLPRGGAIGLQGIVDRVDGYRDDAGVLHLLIYDYKSTPRALRRPFLTGERLQVLIYLLACRQAYGGDGAVAASGAFLAPLYPLRAALERTESVGDETQRRMMLYRPAGVFDQRLADRLDESTSAGPSPVANMRRKSAGGFHSNSDARPGIEIAARLELARATVLQTASGIVEGRVDVAPLVEGRRLACGTCSYQSICRFDTAFNRPRAAERVLPMLADAPGDDAEHCA